MLGKACAKKVFPEPGGPINKILCPPAAAISRARLALDCPLIKARSTSLFLIISVLLNEFTERMFLRRNCHQRKNYFFQFLKIKSFVLNFLPEK